MVEATEINGFFKPVPEQGPTFRAQIVWGEKVIETWNCEALSREQRKQDTGQQVDFVKFKVDGGFIYDTSLEGLQKGTYGNFRFLNVPSTSQLLKLPLT